MSLSDAAEIKKNIATTTLLKQAVKVVEREQKLLERRVTNPELFISYNKAHSQSSLHWNGTQTQLGELLTALDIDDAFHYANGTKAEFTEVVRSFELLLNTTIGNPHDLKRRIIRRNRDMTIYLDNLRNKLLKKCDCK